MPKSNGSEPKPQVPEVPTSGDTNLYLEAKASINWYTIAPTGENCQVTLRNDNWMALMEDAAGLMTWLQNAGWIAKQVGKQADALAPFAAQAQSGVARDTQPAADPEYVPDQAQHLEGTLVYHCVQVAVQPLPNNKVRLDFYGNDKKQPVNQWPTLKWNGTLENGAKLLSGVGVASPSQLEKPVVKPVSWNVYYKQGRERDDGRGFYFDVVGVEQA